MDERELIAGNGRTRGIVAVETDSSAGTATLYRRDGSHVAREVTQLRSWVLGRKTMTTVSSSRAAIPCAIFS